MNRLLTVGTIVAVQAVLVAAGVAPQLSARLTGDTHTFRVEAVDPIDPFRGAYVTLDYPDLRRDDPSGSSSDADGGPVSTPRSPSCTASTRRTFGR
jgi:hypothetical protein